MRVKTYWPLDSFRSLKHLKRIHYRCCNCHDFGHLFVDRGKEMRVSNDLFWVPEGKLSCATAHQLQISNPHNHMSSKNSRQRLPSSFPLRLPDVLSGPCLHISTLPLRTPLSIPEQLQSSSAHMRSPPPWAHQQAATRSLRGQKSSPPEPAHLGMRTAAAACVRESRVLSVNSPLLGGRQNGFRLMPVETLSSVRTRNQPVFDGCWVSRILFVYWITLEPLEQWQKYQKKHYCHSQMFPWL